MTVCCFSTFTDDGSFFYSYLFMNKYVTTSIKTFKISGLVFSGLC
ncbi:hypothetical protein PAUR_a0232 [Pseudoalteromonas aurantia 208]|uniref:Uncharacterized protein n=1 Tax=Pseudoalteromonas aurantia 208 TaxID=1314867 RepID=A0ABR9E7I9_9GAMM|nr:hypothetical protein [Pseudoalteromonas aurantia 208]